MYVQLFDFGWHPGLQASCVYCTLISHQSGQHAQSVEPGILMLVITCVHLLSTVA